MDVGFIGNCWDEYVKEEQHAVERTQTAHDQTVSKIATSDHSPDEIVPYKRRKIQIKETGSAGGIVVAMSQTIEHELDEQDTVSNPDTEGADTFQIGLGEQECESAPIAETSTAAGSGLIVKDCVSAPGADEAERFHGHHRPSDRNTSAGLPLASDTSSDEDESSTYEGAGEDLGRRSQFHYRLRNVKVPVTRKGAKSVRTDYCVYCKRLTKHLVNVHIKQNDVKAALLMSNEGKAKELYRLQCLGNYNWNKKIIEQGEGELAVVRRPTKLTGAHRFLPCTLCLGFFKDKNLKTHKCPLKDSTNKGKQKIALGREMVGSLLTADSEEKKDLDEIISGLKETDANPGLQKIIQEDSLLMEFARMQLMRLGGNELRRRSEMTHLRSKLRMVARFISLVREQGVGPINMREIVHPKYFDTSLKAANVLSKENSQLGLTIGNYIKKIAHLKISDAIRNDNLEQKTVSESFLYLFEAHWNSCVSSSASRRQRLKKLNSAQDLPLTTDLEKLNSYLNQEIVKEAGSERLAKLCLAKLIVFNKRRPMEVAEIKKLDFLHLKKQNESNPEVMKSLTHTERLISKRMHVLEARGKSTGKVRAVYILVPDFVKKKLEIVVSKTPGDFLFTRPNVNSPLDGTATLREVVQDCPGLQRPNLIHSQKLRKYLATVCQLVDMQESELQMIADHMGHSINIHTHVYRLQQHSIEKSKVARILLAADEGTLHRMKAQTDLDHLNLSDLPIPDEADDESGDHESESTLTVSNLPASRELSPPESPSYDSCQDSEVDSSEKIRRVRWTKQELEILGDHWTTGEALPKGRSLQELVKLLPGRSGPAIKTQCQNLTVKAKKQKRRAI